MTRRSAVLAVFLFAAYATGCAGPPGPGGTRVPAPAASTEDANQLRDWLTGTFVSDSRAGAEVVRYMRVRPILQSEPGEWLYVVQWREGDADPERQFVYHLQGGAERGLALEIYSLRHPIENPTNPSDEALAALDRDHLARRRGCRIRLSQDGLSFVGGTRGQDCPADYRGANRLRIELTVRADEVREWLQGYDETGERRWRTPESGRVFRREAAR